MNISSLEKMLKIGVAELNEAFDCFASCYRGHRHWVVIWKEKVEDNNSMRHVIGDIEFKGKQVIVSRDEQGKWYVLNDGKETQKRLNATEIVRYLCHTMNNLT